MAEAPQHGAVEYVFGNARSDNLSDGEQCGSGPSENHRVAMIYDDEGNAIPMPMGNFYYDTYRAPDETTDEDDDKHASDTERAHKPAAFSMKAGNESGSDGECTDEDDDSEDGDQFMRIQVAAAPLKAADRVEVDLDHDKPKPGKSFQSLKRAISSVKAPNMMGEQADPERSRALAGGSRPNIQLNAKEKAASARAAAKSGGAGRQGRMMSFTKEKKQSATLNGLSASVSKDLTSSQSSETAGQDRDRIKPSVAATAPTQRGHKRQGIAAVGRMLSFSSRKKEERKELPADRMATSQGSTTPTTPDSLPGLHERRTEPNIQSNQRGRESTARGNAPGSAGVRPGLQQVGRMMSMTKKKPQVDETEKFDQENVETQFSNDDRERRETEKLLAPPGARMGVKQVGRMLSISKKPASAQNATLAADPSSQPAAASQDRAATTNPSTKRDPTRLGLKAAGRLMSFSRKPAPDASGKAGSGKAGDADARAKVTSDLISGSMPTSSPRLDGRASKFFFSEINSTVIKAGSHLSSESHIRVPVLMMAEYSGPVSKNKWFIDAFTLPHNAFRRECIDVYDILMALARCRADGDVCRDDMKDFHAWWVIAEKFFKCYFNMEREVLFPWVDIAGSKDWELQMALNKMRTMKDGLQSQLEDINKAWVNLETAPLGEIYGAVYKAVDIFCPRVMNYFSDQELLLPQIVRGYYSIEDRLAMDKDMLAAFIGEPLSRKNKDLPHHNLVLLIRWISNPRQLRAWIAKNLNSSGRAAYIKWHASYESDHARLVKSFRNRSRASTMAAMTQS